LIRRSSATAPQKNNEMKTNWSLPLWVAAGLILATPGCGKHDGNTSAASGGAASKKLKLAFVPTARRISGGSPVRAARTPKSSSAT